MCLKASFPSHLLLTLSGQRRVGKCPSLVYNILRQYDQFPYPHFQILKVTEIPQDTEMSL